MTTEYAIYQEVLQRVPHIRHVDITEDEMGGYRVQVFSQSPSSPRHLVREIISLLRTSGWHDIKAENVMVVQVQSVDEPAQTRGRLKISGFSVTYGSSGYEADCRFAYNDHIYCGLSVAPTSFMAVAGAAVAAVNNALGKENVLRLLDATQISVAGVALSLALLIDIDGEVVAGNAVQRELTADESVIRAVLDAINRRFMLFSGQKNLQ